MSIKKKPAVNVAHARNEQAVYKKIVKDDVCPFCTDFARKGLIPKYHTKPIILNGLHWVVTENFNPYKGTKHHFLIIHRKHVVSFSEMKLPAMKELVALTKQLEERFKLPAGVLLFRFGNTDYTGGSVNHFHAHLVLGAKRSAKSQKPLLLYAGYMLDK